MERTYPFFRFAQRFYSPLILVILAALLAAPAGAQPTADWIIDTVAGARTGTGDDNAAVEAQLNLPYDVAVDGSGNLYIADRSNHRIRKVDTAGDISTVAGTGTAGFGGDGAGAAQAQINTPEGLAVDAAGNLYFADSGNHRIRKVDTAGDISTVAGNGRVGFSGDGDKAVAARLNSPRNVAVDGSGNLYIADFNNHRIRKVDTAGDISTVAGNGTVGFDGDGGAALEAQLNSARGVAPDGSGNLYIADSGNHRIRKVDTAGDISTVAGTGTAGFSGDNNPAVQAQLDSPYDVAVDGSGNLYIADRRNNRIRKIDTDGDISTVAGTGRSQYGGDNDLAVEAPVNFPSGVALDGDGNLYIADTNNHRIRKVDASGIITTVAGGSIGDGGPATQAQLDFARGLALDGSDNLYIADTSHNRIRKVDAEGIITTFAGTGQFGYGGDNDPALEAQLRSPQGVALDGSGNLYIADTKNHRIRRVDAATENITRVAGRGTSGGYSGDGGPATAAKLDGPLSVALDGSGNLYIADTDNHRIRKIDTAGDISTVAGSETSGFDGDGAAADQAQLNSPGDVTLDGSGNLYIADTGNHRIRKVDAVTGYISTVAGSETSGFDGDGAAAGQAQLNSPGGVALDGSGNLYIADTDNHRIRKVDTAGDISTVAGSGTAGFDGDGAAAGQALLSRPYDLALDGVGNLYIADSGNSRIRRVAPPPPTVTLTAQPTTITSGQSASLEWTSTYAVGAEIDQGIGEVAVSGAHSVSPTQTTTYTITVRNANGLETTAVATVTVNGAPTADAGDDQTVAEGATVTLDGSGSSDPEEETLTYAWSQTSGETVTLSGATTAAPSFTAPEQLAANATLVFSLTVTDARNAASTADTVTVTVTAGSNDAPTADAGDDQTVAEGAAVTLDGSGSSDPEEETLTYAWSQTSGETVTLSGATTAAPTFTAPEQLTANATLIFSLIVTDARNAASTADTVTVTVTAGSNDAPTADAGDDQTVAEGATVTLDGSGSSDPEEETLTYAWSQTSGETVTLSGATTAAPSFTAPTQLTANATLVFSLTVTDARNAASTADTVTVTITAGSNDAPTAHAGDDQTVAEGAAVTLDGSGSSDPEEETLTYAWSQTSGETVTLSGATTAAPTFTAPEQLAADAQLVFSLTVTDARNAASTADTVTVTVTAGSNDAPTAHAGDDQTVAEGATVTLDGSGSSDPEDEALTYAWTQTSGASVTLSGATTASPTFTAPEQLTANATLVFSLIVTDARNAASTADTVTVTVTAGTNDAPTAHAGDDQTVAEGATVTLDGSGSSDPEDEALDYAWTQTSGESVTLSGATTAAPTFTAPEQLAADAQLVFSLTVTDARNAASAADTVTVTVTAGTNDAPTAHAGDDQTVAEGATVTLDGSGSSDPEDEALDYAWTQTSGESVTLSGATTAAPTFTAPEQLTANATLIFSLIVTDARSATSTADTVTVTVTAGSNDAPTAHAGDDQTVAEGATVTLDGSGSSDPEDEALTYAWSQTSGETVTLSGATTAAPTFTAPEQLTANATLIFSLTVTDARNAASAADTVTVTVTAGTNDAPTAHAGDDQTVAEGATVTLDGSGSSDPEDETLDYAWTQTSGETVTLSGATTATPTFTAPEQLAADAQLVFSLTVTDARNAASAADTVTVTVTAGTNDAPTAHAGDDQTVAEGATVTLDGSGSSDPEDEALDYAWTQTSGESVTLSGATTAAPTFTAPEQLTANATLIFSLIVTDARSATSTADTVTVTVTAGSNDAPTADAGDDQTVAEGATVTLDGSGSSDPEEEALNYAWSQTSGETVTLSGATTAAPTFTAPEQLTANATLIFSLIVTDARNAASTADTVTVTVTAGSNDAPTAHAGDDQTVAEGAAVTLDGSGSSDPEDEALTYAWTQTSGETVTLSGATTASPTFTAPEQLTANATLIFSLIVTDARSATSTADTVTVTVTAGSNDAPTAHAGDDQTVAEGATVTLDGSGSSDPEDEALTYAWSQTSGETVTLNGATTAAPTFTAPTQLAADAQLVFSLTVTDARNAASAADTVTVTVTAGTNDAPTAHAGDDQTVAEGATVTLDGSGSSDPEEETLTYAWSQTSGTTVTLNGATTAAPTFTAPEQLTANAQLVFSLTVTDARNAASAADTVTVTATAGDNEAPTAHAGDDQTVAEGATVTLDGSGSSDPEDEALTYAWTQTSGETVTLSGATTAAPTFTAPEQLTANATLIFSLIVTDARNAASTADTVTVTVTAGSNDAPTAHAGDDQTVAEGAAVTLDGSGSSDPEDEALDYAWTQTSGETVTLSGATTASPTFTAPEQLTANATLIFSLIVTDARSATSTADTVTVTVTAGSNDAPTAHAGDDQTVAEGATVTLDGSGSSDPEDEALTYAWTQTSGETVTLSGATTAAPTFTAPTQLAADAQLVFSLTVTDARNAASAAHTVTVTATAGDNEAPTAHAGDDQTVAEGATVTLDGSGSSDPEDEALTYAWTQTSGETVTLSGATTAAPTFTAPTQLTANATLVFSLTVTDARNAASTADTVAVTVTAGDNEAPTAHTGDDQTVAEGATVTLDGSGSSDPEDETLTYAWSQTSGTSVTLNGAATANPTFTAPTQLTADEQLVFSLTVTDARNAASAADTVTVTVTAGTNEAPTADAGDNQTVAEGATVTLDGSGSSDPEEETLTYAWSQTSGASVTLNGAATANPTFTAPEQLAADEQLVFSLTVTDARNAASAADTVTVTVTAGDKDAPTATLTATPAAIVRGASATLQWSSTNAVSAEIDQGIGAVALSGTQSVSPTATTTYTLTVSAANGATAEAQAAVTVSDPPPPGARTIDTVAGDGTPGFSGDGRAAAEAQLNTPSGVALDAAGNIYIADTSNHRIRKVDGNGAIDTAAGDGMSSRLGLPTDTALDSAGNLYIADTSNHRIRRVDAAGNMTTVAGSGVQGHSGDGGPAVEAQLNAPRSVAMDAAGNVYIADTGNHRIRIVDAAGNIDTVAGSGAPGFDGDEGPATGALLNAPQGVAVDAAGNLYIADTGNHRILSVDAEGAIDTVAGTGIQGFDGDGGPAVEAQLNAPSGVAVDAEGAYLYIADTGNQRIRTVDAAGNIDTAAGTGAPGSDGDGGLAGAAQLNAPAGVAVDGAGNVYIADTGNHRIRKVDAPPDETVPPEPPVTPRPEPELPAARARTFELSFTLAQDAEPAAQQVVLYAENGAANFRAQPGPQWIGAEPASGRLEEDEETTITVTVDSVGLRVGAYRGRLYIRSEGRLTGRVWVALEVLPPVGPAVAERGVFNAAVQSALGARTNPFSAVRLLPVAPGSMVAVSGENFTGGESFEAGGFPLPVSLSGVKVSFDGLEARLFAVSPQRIEAQLPSLLNLEALAGGGTALATVVVETAEGGSYARRFVTAAQAPGIFTASGEGRGQGAVLLAGAGALAAPRGYAAESRPARAGEVLEIYATGLGPMYPPVADGENSCGPEGVCLADGANLVLRRTAERPRVTIGGVEVAEEAVLFAGLAPALAAVNLVVVEVPQGIEPSAAAEALISIGGRTSQPGVTIAVE